MTPFTKNQRQQLLERVRRHQSDVRLKFSDDGPLVFISASLLGLASVTSLTADIERMGGGLICWEKDKSDNELCLQYELFVRSKVYGTPLKNADMRSVRKADSVLFSSGSFVLFGLYVGTEVDLQITRNFLRSIRRSGNWSFMADAKEQIALLERTFEDAKALVDRYAGQRSAALREAATKAIVYVLKECEAQRPETLDHIVQMAKGELTASGRRKKRKRELPPLPSGYEWPTELYSDSNEAKKHGGIVAYLERVWLPLIQAGLVNRALLRLADKRADQAIATYQYNDGGPRRLLPSHVLVPSKGKAGRPPHKSKVVKRTYRA